MTILALDQSTRISGWSIWKDKELIAYGKWEYSDEDISLRIHRLCQQIQQQIEKYEVSLVIIENIQLQKQGNGIQNVDTFHKLAWVQGAIMLLCKQLNINYELIYPSEWRAICNFLKGNDSRRDNQKKITQQWCLNTYNKKCTQDEADAIAIGYAITHRRTSAF